MNTYAAAEPTVRAHHLADERESPDGDLERVRAELEAARAILVAFDHEPPAMRVVATAGRPLLATGAVLPLSASHAIAAASMARGYRPQDDRLAVGPLDRLSTDLGLGVRVVIPIESGGHLPRGAVDLAWTAQLPPRGDAEFVVAGFQAELLALLDRPASATVRRTLLVCHEDPLIAYGVAREAERAGASVVIAHTARDALAQVKSDPPDLILCSDRLEPVASMPEIARGMRQGGAAAPLLVLARVDSSASFEAALEAGASGYLPLAAAVERLPEAIETLLAGQCLLDGSGADTVAPRLTRREYEVLAACERGLSHKQVANELTISVSTVKTHTRSMYAKLDATSRTEALHKARAAGLI